MIEPDETAPLLDPDLGPAARHHVRALLEEPHSIAELRQVLDLLDHDRYPRARRLVLQKIARIC